MNLEMIIQANKEYKELSEVLHQKYKELCVMNSLIDLAEVESKMDYSQIKELYLMTHLSIEDKAVQAQFKKLMERKKIDAYPEILGVHYYPILKELTFLSTEDQIKLDRELKDSNNHYHFKTRFSKEVVQFLIDHQILERRYELSCCCGGFHCDTKDLSKAEYLQYLHFWERRERGEFISEEEEDALGYGYLYLYCDREEAELELKSVEDFKNYAKTRLTVIQKPDLTLENL